MTDPLNPETPLPLATRLQRATAEQHENMHVLMQTLQPFESRARYARFVAAQYLFQADLAPLLADEAIRQRVPDTDRRGHLLAARQDLTDLQTPVPEAPPPATRDLGLPEKLGWLYVAEGSTLGAALLLKEVSEKLGLGAQFGARHLAAYPEGRAAAWRRFVAALNDSGLAHDAQERVIAGARAAFHRFGQLLHQQFADLRSV